VAECNTLRTDTKNQIWSLQKGIEEMRQKNAQLKNETKAKQKIIDALQKDKEVYTRLFARGNQAEEDSSRESVISFDGQFRSPEERFPASASEILEEKPSKKN